MLGELGRGGVGWVRVKRFAWGGWRPPQQAQGLGERQGCVRLRRERLMCHHRSAAHMRSTQAWHVTPHAGNVTPHLRLARHACTLRHLLAKAQPCNPRASPPLVLKHVLAPCLVTLTIQVHTYLHCNSVQLPYVVDTGLPLQVAGGAVLKHVPPPIMLRQICYALFTSTAGIEYHCRW